MPPFKMQIGAFSRLSQPLPATPHGFPMPIQTVLLTPALALGEGRLIPFGDVTQIIRINPSPNGLEHE